MRLLDIREEYVLDQLGRTEADPDPLAQFREWLGHALEAKLREPNAMTLATASLDGRPAARVVLLKAFDERGFVFSSNYESRKAAELERNPMAGLVFFWNELERQVRIEGRVEKTSDEESNQIFERRPLGAKLGAWASRQSQVITGREELERRLHELQEQYAGREVSRPPHWGGYRLVPDRMEFWQGRPHRLHDRMCYLLRPGTGWEIQRLAP